MADDSIPVMLLPGNKYRNDGRAISAQMKDILNGDKMSEEQLNDIDLMIAEKVMGWEYGKDFLQWRQTQGVMLSWLELDDRKGQWSPSRDIATAWEVVERILEIGDPMPYPRKFHGETFGFRLETHTESSCDKWECTLPSVTAAPPFEEMNRFWVESSAETAPLAICLSALKSVGIEI